MDSFLKLSLEDRKAAFEETAKLLDVRPIIIEKDFWVCWTLKQIFNIPELGKHITFKGGTSLSKAYRLIDRFSEDIDLTISRTAPYLKDATDPMAEDISGKERQRRIEALKEGARQFVANFALPILQKKFETELSKDPLSSKSDGFRMDEGDADKQTILFDYPMFFSDGTWERTRWEELGTAEASYIKASIRLEFGARGETKPNEEREITPYAAEIFPKFFNAPDSNVHVLAVERTFWEKVTILHAMYHGTKIRDRMSRHYYDTYILSQKGIADQALENTALLKQVVKNKSLMFKDNKASYETAVIGSLRLVPKPEMLPELKKDYVAMEQMFMKKSPDFDDMMNGISDLEKRINSTLN